MGSQAIHEVREWVAQPLWSFVAGVVVASFIALALWRWEVVVGMVWRGCAGLKVVVRRVRGGKVDLEGEGAMDGPEHTVMEVETTSALSLLSPSPRSPLPKKPFEFRKRLWNEPPEGQDLGMDYSNYEFFDIVQKEFKEMGSKDFEWKTKWLDLYTEGSLLSDYRYWARHQSEDEEASEKDRAFYNELYKDLHIEEDDVWEDENENNSLHGKDWKDQDELLALMDEIITREEQKRNRA